MKSAEVRISLSKVFVKRASPSCRRAVKRQDLDARGVDRPLARILTSEGVGTERQAAGKVGYSNGKCFLGEELISRTKGADEKKHRGCRWEREVQGMSGMGRGESKTSSVDFVAGAQPEGEPATDECRHSQGNKVCKESVENRLKVLIA